MRNQVVMTASERVNAIVETVHRSMPETSKSPRASGAIRVLTATYGKTANAIPVKSGTRSKYRYASLDRVARRGELSCERHSRLLGSRRSSHRRRNCRWSAAASAVAA